MSNKLDDFLSMLKNNPFNRSAYSCSLELENALNMTARFCNRDAHIKQKDSGLHLLNPEILKANIETINSRIPPFQRDNDKWTDEMQCGYILNVLKGCKGFPISLYSLDDTMNNCFLLDGLQRITAIARFLIDQDMVFTYNQEKISASELLNSELRNRVLSAYPFDLRIYNFKSEIEAVNFYIELNKNISHSARDIEKAEIYRDFSLAKEL